MAITTYAQIQKKLDDIARQSLEKLALEVQALWENYIQTRFYDQYSPVEYERTYQLLSSVVMTNVYKLGNQWTIDIFMDEKTATQGYKEINVETNWIISSQGSHGGFISTEGRFYDELIADLKSGTIYNEFARILQRDMGLKITRK